MRTPTPHRTVCVTARGRDKFVTTSLTDEEALDRLQELVGTPEAPGPVTSDFARSLVRQHRQRGLSQKQVNWVVVLVVEHDKRQNTPSLSLPNISALLQTAREHGAKAPKLTYPAGDASPTGKIRFSVAGANSRYCGQIQVTDGGPFGDNEYYGRMNPETGVLTGRSIPEPVQALLTAIDGDATQFSALAGFLSSSCCYCNRELTTAESRGAGYGPICANKYGLPWGAETAAKALTLEDVKVALKSLSEPLQDVLRPLVDSYVSEDEQAMYDGEIQEEVRLGIRPAPNYVGTGHLDADGRDGLYDHL